MGRQVNLTTRRLGKLLDNCISGMPGALRQRQLLRRGRQALLQEGSWRAAGPLIADYFWPAEETCTERILPGLSCVYVFKDSAFGNIFGFVFATAYVMCLCPWVVPANCKRYHHLFKCSVCQRGRVFEDTDRLWHEFVPPWVFGHFQQEKHDTANT